MTAIHIPKIVTTSPANPISAFCTSSNTCDETPPEKALIDAATNTINTSELRGRLTLVKSIEDPARIFTNVCRKGLHIDYPSLRAINIQLLLGSRY